MSGGARLALGILLVTIGLGCFYFAFHPGGVANSDGTAVQNPHEALQWLTTEFANTANGTNSTSSSSGGS